MKLVPHLSYHSHYENWLEIICRKCLVKIGDSDEFLDSENDDAVKTFVVGDTGDVDVLEDDNIAPTQIVCTTDGQYFLSPNLGMFEKYQIV